ncbi:hypothetical protein Lalb_Chr17g0342671 [Lupinus albus]|uniref:Uncharacterized protein n=1 Tax=Lupinus albus TaxID=3870 RepID=A0A6A4P7R4_LUPAL|nr:hypothetical protein Lalb_Chr17g0342671 [Lupinus albus]
MNLICALGDARSISNKPCEVLNIRGRSNLLILGLTLNFRISNDEEFASKNRINTSAFQLQFLLSLAYYGKSFYTLTHSKAQALALIWLCKNCRQKRIHENNKIIRNMVIFLTFIYSPNR